jgi:hypothetical protein
MPTGDVQNVTVPRLRFGEVAIRLDLAQEDAVRTDSILFRDLLTL